MKTLQYPYTKHAGMITAMPYLDLMLYHDERSYQVTALLDTGAMLNVLPYDYGLALGFRWKEQTLPLRLSGVMKGLEAYPITLHGTVEGFLPVKLVFAWANRPHTDIPVILGEANFFRVFRVCFDARSQMFDITGENVQSS